MIEEAKARLLEAIARERRGAGFEPRAGAALRPGRPDRRPEEHALGGFAAFPVVTNERLVGLLALGGKAVARMRRDSAASWARWRTRPTS